VITSSTIHTDMTSSDLREIVGKNEPAKGKKKGKNPYPVEGKIPIVVVLAVVVVVVVVVVVETGVMAAAGAVVAVAVKEFGQFLGIFQSKSIRFQGNML